MFAMTVGGNLHKLSTFKDTKENAEKEKRKSSAKKRS